MDVPNVIAPPSADATDVVTTEKSQEPVVVPSFGNTTTVNSGGVVAGNGAIMHSHGSNFGRYVVGCPACVKKYPEGPPTRRPRRIPGYGREGEERSTTESMPTMQSQMATKSVAHPITGNDLLEAIKSLQGDQRDALIAFAQELRKPEPEEQAVKDAAKARKVQDKIDMRRVVEDARAIKERNQAICESFGHKKENGRSAVSGQVHNDNLLHLLCVRCGKEFPGVKPDHEHMPSGISVL